MKGRFRIRTLGDEDRSGFLSGVEPLDRYFREQVTQDIRRRVTNCFIAVDERNAVAGYYTFAATGIALSDLPEREKKRLPRYPLVPAALIGRLAVDGSRRGHGLGSALIADAGFRAMRADPAVFALVVDAVNDDAMAFYRHLGFQSLVSREGNLFLPLATFARATGHGN